MDAQPPERLCHQCGACMARDNTDRICAACRKKARDVLFQAPEVPAWFWDSTEIRKALATRHMGKVVRAFRTHTYHGRPISQAVAAGWLYLTQSQLSRIESGPPMQELDRLTQWAHTLRIPARLLWFAVPEAADSLEGPSALPTGRLEGALDGDLDTGGGLVPLVPPARPGQCASADAEPEMGVPVGTVGAGPLDDEEDMERRRLLESLAVLGATTALQGDALETIRHSFDASFVAASSEYTADDWQEIAAEYAHTYLATPPQTLLPDLAKEIVALHRIMKKDKDSQGWSDLCSAGATLATIMAATTNSLGLSRESRHWWRSARHAADASGSRDLRVWVHGYESVSSLYQGRPFRLVLDRAEAALRIADGHASPGMMEAMACKAQVLAQLGAADEAEKILGRMRDTFDTLPSALVAERSSLLTWPRHRLLHTESFVYTAVGYAREAEKAQEAALAAYPTSMPRERAQVELHRATVLVRGGAVNDGIAHAEGVLQGLPVKHHTRLVRVVAGTVLEAVPDTETGKPSVNAYRERLALPTAVERQS